MRWEEEKDRGKVVSIFTPDDKSWGRLFSDPIPVVPERSYLLSIWYKCKINGSAYIPNVTIFLDNVAKDFGLPTSVSWKKWGIVVNIPSGVDKITVSPHLYHRPEQIVWFDDIRLTLLPDLKIKEGKLLFQDNFDKFTKWLVISGAEHYYKIIETKDIEGKKNNVLEVNCPSSSMIKADLSESVKNIKISMKIKFLNLQINKERKGICFIGFGDYVVQICRAIELCRPTYGNPISYYAVVHLSEKLRTIDKWYQLVIETSDSRIRVFINGELVMDEYSEALKGEKGEMISLAAHNVHFYVDDIKVVELTGGK
ncbi:hypothetical protein J7K25_01275 [bacterium]|nr:hypothetical protein [bacterium]